MAPLIGICRVDQGNHGVASDNGPYVTREKASHPAWPRSSDSRSLSRVRPRSRISEKTRTEPTNGVVLPDARTTTAKGDLTMKLSQSTGSRRVAALVIAGLWVTACAASTTMPSPTGSSAVGRYNLVSANSSDLPAVVSENPATGFQQEVTGGHADLRADRTCSVSTEYRYTESGNTSTNTSVNEGTWATSGDTVTFTFGSDHLTGTLDGDVLTVRVDVEMVYRRQ